MSECRIRSGVVGGSPSSGLSWTLFLSEMVRSTACSRERGLTSIPSAENRHLLPLVTLVESSLPSLLGRKGLSVLRLCAMIPSRTRSAMKSGRRILPLGVLQERDRAPCLGQARPPRISIPSHVCLGGERGPDHLVPPLLVTHTASPSLFAFWMALSRRSPLPNMLAAAATDRYRK